MWYHCPLHISNGLKSGEGGVPEALRQSGGTSWIVGYSQSPHNHLLENAIKEMKINPLLGQLVSGNSVCWEKRNGFLSHPRNLKMISGMLKYESFCRFPKQFQIFMSWISLCMPPRVHSRWSWCPSGGWDVSFHPFSCRQDPLGQLESVGINGGWTACCFSVAPLPLTISKASSAHCIKKMEPIIDKFVSHSRFPHPSHNHPAYT